MRTSAGLVLVFLVSLGSCTFDPEQLSTPGIQLTDGSIDSFSDAPPVAYDSGGGGGDSPVYKPETSVVTPDGQGPRETNGPESAGTVLDVGSDKAFPTLDLPSSSDAQQAPPDVPVVVEVGPADVPRRDAVVGDGAGSSDAPPDLVPDAQDASADSGGLLSGLIVYYPCETANGATLPDKSGNGNDGKLVSGVVPDGGTPATGSGYSFGAGKVGKALTLAKAAHGYVSMPPGILTGAAEMTIAAWLKVATDQQWARIYDLGVNANIYQDTATGPKYMILMPYGAGGLTFAISVNGYLNEDQLSGGSGIVPSNGWTHVAVVIGGTDKMYVNGALAGSIVTNLRPSDLGIMDYAFIGRSQFPADPYFDGQIDEFRVYNRALTAAEVQALYQFTGP